MEKPNDDSSEWEHQRWFYEQYRPSDVEFFNLDYLTELRDNLDQIIKLYHGTELYKAFWLLWVNEIYALNGNSFHAFADKESVTGVCIAFWYGTDIEPEYPPEFLEELAKAESETEYAQYVIVSDSKVCYIKRKEFISYETAKKDAGQFIDLLIRSGY